MGESVKALILLAFIVSSLVAGVLWFHDQPNDLVWTWRWIMTIVVVACLAALILLQARRDLVPDFLVRIHKHYFNSDGLCFAFRIEADQGFAFVIVDFQSQFEGECRAIVALRPARKFLMNREPIAHVLVPIECPAAGFGTSRVPIAIPMKLQGKRATFEVGATVEFPKGKGRRLRFADGMFLRANSNLRDHVRTTLMLASFATGRIVYSRQLR